MIEFRQKIFVAPLVGTALSGLGHLGNASMIYSVKQTNDQMKQAEEQMRQEKQLEKSRQRFEKKQQEEQLKAQKEQQEKQLQLQREQMKQQRELQREGNTMAALAPSSSDIQSMAEKGFSMIEFKRKNFGDWNWENIKGLAKDTGKIISSPDGKHHFGRLAFAGLVMGASGYAVNKAISSDMKKSGIDLNRMRQDTVNQEIPQKTYSAVPQVLANVGNKVSRVWKLAKKNRYGGEIATGLGFTGILAIPTVMGYVGEKQQLKQQYGNQLQQNNDAQQRQYGVGDWLARKTAPIRKHPGQTVLGFLSQLTMGGGHKAAEGAARSFQNQGTISGNVLTQKVGNFLANNKKTAIAATIPVGLATTSLLWEGGEKLAKGISEGVDKNAYTYENWKNKQIGEE